MSAAATMPPRGTLGRAASHGAAAASFLSILTLADQLAPGAASRLRAGVLAGIPLDGVDDRGPAEKLPELLGAAVALTRVEDRRPAAVERALRPAPEPAAGSREALAPDG